MNSDDNNNYSIIIIIFRRCRFVSDHGDRDRDKGLARAPAKTTAGIFARINRTSERVVGCFLFNFFFFRKLLRYKYAVIAHTSISIRVRIF